MHNQSSQRNTIITPGYHEKTDSIVADFHASKFILRKNILGDVIKIPMRTLKIYILQDNVFTNVCSVQLTIRLLTLIFYAVLV